MGSDSTIAWTDHTYNPHIGCTKVGVGCEGCYAEAYDKRFPGPDGRLHWGQGVPRRRTSEQTRNAPHRWNRAAMKAGCLTKVFSHSLSDVFDNEVPQEWREDEFKIWRETPHLRWIVLTKRPGNIAKMLPKNWSPDVYPNVGFCCSVSIQEEWDRELPKLVQIHAAWLGVSIEPQVDRIVMGNTRFWAAAGIRWIITGGASAQPGYDPPPYNADWARSLISECGQAGIACFVKQLGSNAWDGTHPFKTQDKAGADPEEWPADICVREFPVQITR